jgi:hypothetical protein
VCSTTQRRGSGQHRRDAVPFGIRQVVGVACRDIIVPVPKSEDWVRTVSAGFRDYLTTIVAARERFGKALSAREGGGFEFIASVAEVAGNG